MLTATLALLTLTLRMRLTLTPLYATSYHAVRSPHCCSLCALSRVTCSHTAHALSIHCGCRAARKVADSRVKMLEKQLSIIQKQCSLVMVRNLLQFPHRVRALWGFARWVCVAYSSSVTSNHAHLPPHLLRHPQLLLPQTVLCHPRLLPHTQSCP